MAHEMETTPESNRNMIDLSQGTARIVDSIRYAYPHLTAQEVERLGNYVLDEVGIRIAAKQSLAFFGEDVDGEPSLTVLKLDIVDRDRPFGS